MWSYWYNETYLLDNINNKIIDEKILFKRIIIGDGNCFLNSFKNINCISSVFSLYEHMLLYNNFLIDDNKSNKNINFLIIKLKTKNHFLNYTQQFVKIMKRDITILLLKRLYWL